MRLFTKIAAASTFAISGAAGGFIYYQRASQSTAAPFMELSAKEFNALQDTTFLNAALNPQHLPWTYAAMKQQYTNLRDLLTQPTEPSSDGYVPTAEDVKLVFYRLLGCPYCAKVEAVLQYYDIAYEEVWVDPISGNGLPDRRYQLAPQLYFTPITSDRAPPATKTSVQTAVEEGKKPKKGAFVVDSAAIAAALAKPLHYEAELANPHTSATRDWITNHFHGASFAITNSTFRNAYATYTYVTPSNYQNFFYHLVGSGALSALSRLKIQPRIVAKLEAVERASSVPPAEGAESNGLWMLSTASREALAAALRSGVPDAWLREELAVFLARRPAGAVFHGGAAPDLADVEMYGVSRVVDEHPRLGPVVREGAFGEWQSAMQSKFRTRTGHLYS